jgi:hypothetical protein
MTSDYQPSFFFGVLGSSPTDCDVTLHQFFESSAECTHAAEMTKRDYPTYSFRMWQRNQHGQWYSFNQWIV